MNPDLMLSLDESHHSAACEMDLSSSDNDIDQTDQDWDWVPPSIPEMEPVNRSAETCMTSTFDRNPGGQDANMAGGIMSSVASLWRAATSRMDSK